MISIIVPIHNTKKYLKECLNSILKQTYPNLEILCIDSSTDDSSKIIESFAKRDKRIIHIKDSNNSYGYKLNKGIQLSKGDYIGIVDSDDYIDKDFYKEAKIEISSDKNIEFIKFDYYSFCINNSIKRFTYHHNLIDRNLYNRIISAKRMPDILSKSDVSIWSGLYRKKFLIKNNIMLFESPGASFQDAGFAILTHLYASKIKYIEKAYYYYRHNNPDASSSEYKNPYVLIDEYRNIEKNIEKNCNLPSDLKKQLSFRKISAYWWNFNRLNTSLSIKFLNKILKEIKSLSDLYDEMPYNIQIRYDMLRYGKKIVNKKVSIIVPIYNSKKYLNVALDSLLKQIYKNIEIICVNDGSIDSSYELLNKYSNLDNRIKVINRKHRGGLSVARNTGLKHVTGDYIMFVDSDDYIDRNAVARLLTNAVSKDYDVVEFEGKCVFESKSLYNEKLNNYFVRKNSYKQKNGKQLISKFIENRECCDVSWLLFCNKKWFIDDNNFKFMPGIIYEDNELWVRIHMKMNRVLYLNEQLYFYRIHRNSITTRKKTALNVYSRIKGYMSILNTIEKEDLSRRQKKNLCIYSERLLLSLESLISEVGKKETSKVLKNKLNKKERDLVLCCMKKIV